MVTRSALLGLALLAAPPAAARDEAGAAIDAVSRAWRDGATAERLAALESLARFDEPRCVDAVLEVLEHDEVALFPAARRVLGSYTAERTLKRLQDRGLQHRDGRVRAQVLSALGEARPEGFAWRDAARAGLDDEDPRVRAAAVRTLSRARDGERLDRILALAIDPAERVRLEVPEALERLAGPRAQAALCNLLNDPRWRVRTAAARALADLREPSAVLALVDRLAVESGRLREDLLDILERLTGRNFEMDIEAWKTFLREAPPDFLKQGDAVALGRRSGTGVASSSLRWRKIGTRYHTIASLSQRFVLLTDLSGSMETPLPARAGEKQPGRSRLAVAQDELYRLIDTLSPGDAFELLTFSDEARLWQGQLAQASEHERSAARAEIARWTPGGSTNMHAALAAVFDLAEHALDGPPNLAHDFDTLFVLSDGAPSSGDVRDPALLLSYVAERNRALQIRIHTVSLAAEPEGREFLEKLAALGGGQHVALDGGE